MKNNKTIKIVSLMSIALMFVFGLALNVLAVTVDGNGKVTDKGTITVTGVNAGDTFAAYKIVDTYYNSTTNSFSQQFTSDFQAFLTSTNGATSPAVDYSAMTVAQYMDLVSGSHSSGSVETPDPQSGTSLDKVVSAYAGYIKDAQTPPSSTALTTSGTTATSPAVNNQNALDAGSYLILPTVSTKVYAVMVGNIEYKPDENDATAWTLNNAEIVAKASNPSVTAYLESSGTTDTSYTTEVDTIHMHLTTALPTYPTNATNKTYVVGIDSSVDQNITGRDGKFNDYELTTVTSGATTYTVDSTNHAIKDGNDTIATYTEGAHGVTVTFTDITAVAGKTFDFDVTAVLDDTATKGDPHIATVSLTYANDPYGDGTDTDTANLTARTYGLNVYLQDGSDPTTGLAGAVYKVCHTVNNAEVCLDSSHNITTDSNGLASTTGYGLAAGDWYAVEVTAPTGYAIDATHQEASVGNSTYADPDHNGFYTPAQAATNSTSGFLPFTGGVGTIIYTCIGLVIVALTALFIIAFKKKNNKEEEQAETI